MSVASEDTPNIPRLVVAAGGSGGGKTSVTVALCRAFASRGLRVAMYKCGPDYLDPTYHQRASGYISHNLDGWMMGQDAVRSTFIRTSAGADLALIEGVMGLFDGASPQSDAGSTAEIARWLAAPVLLVLDCSGLARTVAALAQGLARFDPSLQFAGLICNRVGSRGHLDLLRQAGSEVPVVGGFPRRDALAFPERHLGLRTASDPDAVGEELFQSWGALAAEWLDLDRILDAARRSQPIAAQVTGGPEAPLIAPLPQSAVSCRCRIGIARDEAFHFYYEDNLELLRAAGAELVNFSPIHDQRLPEVDGIYIGGGYPEVYAEQLSTNTGMRAQLAAAARAGMPIYAECGGLMYLAQAIRTLDGISHPMVGVIAGEAHMRDRLQALGYVEVVTAAASPLGPAGTRFRGHQFRYSELVADGDFSNCIYGMRTRRGPLHEREGYVMDNVLASYVHGHWASNPAIARHFVSQCAASAAAARGAAVTPAAVTPAK